MARAADEATLSARILADDLLLRRGAPRANLRTEAKIGSQHLPINFSDKLSNRHIAKDLEPIVIRDQGGLIGTTLEAMEPVRVSDDGRVRPVTGASPDHQRAHAWAVSRWLSMNWIQDSSEIRTDFPIRMASSSPRAIQQ